MIVGGILICVGLYFSSCKAKAYTAWIDKHTTQLAANMAQTAEQHVQNNEQFQNEEISSVEICEV